MVESSQKPTFERVFIVKGAYEVDSDAFDALM